MKSTITFILCFLLFSCNQNKKHKNTDEYGYEQEQIVNTIDESEKVKETQTDLKGLYSVFLIDSSTNIISNVKNYSIKVENLISPGYSDPNDYLIRNFLNEGDEWRLEGTLDKNLLIINGNNIVETKRVNGFIKTKKDSLYVNLTIRKNIKKMEDFIKKIDEVWIRQNQK